MDNHIDIMKGHFGYAALEEYKGVPYMIQLAASGQDAMCAATLVTRGTTSVQVRESRARRIIDAMTSMGPISSEHRQEILDRIYKRCKNLGIKIVSIPDLFNVGAEPKQDEEHPRPYVGKRPKSAPPTVEEVARGIAKKLRDRLPKKVIHKAAYGGYADPDGPPQPFKPTRKQVEDRLTEHLRTVKRSGEMDRAMLNLNLDLGAPGNHGRYRID